MFRKTQCLSVVSNDLRQPPRLVMFFCALYSRELISATRRHMVKMNKTQIEEKGRLLVYDDDFQGSTKHEKQYSVRRIIFPRVPSPVISATYSLVGNVFIITFAFTSSAIVICNLYCKSVIGKQSSVTELA